MVQLKKPKLQKLSRLHKIAWDFQSKFLRQQAADENGIVKCFTCPKEAHWKKMQIGHYLHGDRMDFILDNLRPQCRQCNFFKSGQGAIFGLKLAQEVGFLRVKELHVIHKQGRVANRQELAEIIEKYGGSK
jgi:hypothetical protein